METFHDSDLLGQLYANVSPKGFEALVKDILEAIGFDDVEVTGRSGDSGVDLTATLRRSEIPGIDTNVSCIIQAKRLNPQRPLNPRFVRELRGAMQSGQRGVMITTSRVSRKTIEEEALRDMSRIVLVIDGPRLIGLCKDQNIGMLTRYEIDEEYFSKLEASEPELETAETGLIGSKLITDNDVRARILRLPNEVKRLVPVGDKITLHFEDGTKQSLRVDKHGTYVGGVTHIYRRYGLVDDDGNPHEMLAEWEVAEDGFMVKFKKTEERPNIAGALERIFRAKFTRIPGTSIFVGDDRKLLCRYSKRYTKDINYWYGMTPKDIDLMREKRVEKLAFFCSTTKVVFMDQDRFLEELGNLNVTETGPGVVRHYHIHLREAGDRIVWVLKGGVTRELREIYELGSQNVT